MRIRLVPLGMVLFAALFSNVCGGEAVSDNLVVRPVPFTQVTIDDKFWKPRVEINRTVSIPHSLEMLNRAGNIRNLERAARGERDGYEGPCYIDSDLFKAVEAAAFSLGTHPDKELERKLDQVIAAIAAAQQPDGYLNTWVSVTCPQDRWKNLRDKHELYCAGHLIEAAVAHRQATGKRTLLDVAIRYADYIHSVFGNDTGKREGYPGHQELELALFKLWRLTGEQRYFNLAKFFLESRGDQFFAKEHGTPLDKYNGEYWQDNVKIRDTKKIVGHAVRAVYLLSGVADYAAVTGDASLVEMLERVWDNTTGANMYVTGGIGSSARNEGFTRDFDLPNFAGYQETCASVAMMMWNHRMNMMSGEARYADALERTMYNGFLSGVALDGKKFLYVNPLASKGRHHRADWYSCACCPPNVTRTLAQLGGYLYGNSDDGILVNQYVAGSVRADVNGTSVGLTVETDYPWDGTVKLTPDLEAATSFALHLRIPYWCEGESVLVNDQAVASQRDGGYLVINREWSPGDIVKLILPMKAVQVLADSRVEVNAARAAVQRGPIIYCAEQVDQAVPVEAIALPPGTELTAEHRENLLGGVTVLRGKGVVCDMATSAPAGLELYRKMTNSTEVDLTLIPYYAWDNRDAGPMAVWLPVAPQVTETANFCQTATIGVSSVGKGSRPEACRDGFEIINAADLYASACHWLPVTGGSEWVEYSWTEPVQVDRTRVYWIDDEGRGEIRVPKAWRLEYKAGDEWKPVVEKGDYSTARGQWCHVQFEPVTTTAIRLIVDMQPGFSAGVQEWEL